MNYDTMPAGPEMDRLMGKVMEWDPDEEVGARVWCNYGYHKKCEQWWCMDLCPAIPWSPSTNIAHAWEVVDKIRDKPGWLSLDRCVNGDGSDEWIASFNSGSIAHADTAPLAICRAALKATSR